LLPESAAALDTFKIGLLDSVELSLSHVQRPANDSERILFTNLFNSLVRLDCREVIRPGLADSWISDSNGAVWTFSLRESDAGSGFAASAEVSGAMATSLTEGKIRGVDSVQELNQRRLRIFLSRGTDSVPRFLADPALSSPERLATQESDRPGTIELPATGSRPVIQFHFLLTGDPRDALDREVDLLVSRDPSLVEYAASRAEFNTFALPWTRTYVLLQPAGAKVVGVTLSDAERQSLARDAVRADARAAKPLQWWNEVDGCVGAIAEASPVSRRIVYNRGDEVARALAERVVALADPGTGLRAVGVAGSELTTLLRRGAERAYILALPRQTFEPCRETAALPPGARLHPLIDTRAHAIVRKGAPPLTVDWDGTVRVDEP
jgi:hypothetical protein